MSVASYNLFRGQLMGSNKLLALKALSIAEQAHKGQFRKDGITPYIEHPVKVASFLYTLHIRDDEILAIAILHDVLEDTSVQANDLLNAGFSKEVVNAVCGSVYLDYIVYPNNGSTSSTVVQVTAGNIE